MPDYFPYSFAEEPLPVRGGVPKRRDVQKDDRPARETFLDEVGNIINGPRNTTYGESEDNFARIASMWRPYFKARYGVDVDITPGDVGIIMILMKAARIAYDPDHKDSWVDLAGYAATGWQAQVTPTDL